MRLRIPPTGDQHRGSTKKIDRDVAGTTLDEILDVLADKIAARIMASGAPLPSRAGSQREAGRTARLMDAPRTAEYLGRSLRSVYHLIDAGKLPVVRIDNKLQVDRVLLDKMIEDRTLPTDLRSAAGSRGGPPDPIR